MTRKYPRLAEVEDTRRSTAETRAAFRDDMRLRDHGFAIAVRPNEYTAVWTRDGRFFTQGEALAACDREDRAGGRGDADGEGIGANPKKTRR